MTTPEDGRLPSPTAWADLARLLRSARERRGLSQAAAALAAEVQPQTVSRIERLDADVLLATLRRYLDGLGYEIELAVRDATTGEVAGRVVLRSSEGDLGPR